MRVYRLCRAQYPPFDGEGANRFGGRWNSKGNRAIYASENRSLAVLEILVHLSDVLPDKYVLASADLPEAMLIESVSEQEAPENWGTLNVAKQQATRETGDQWLRLGRSAVLAVPSVISGERNFLRTRNILSLPGSLYMILFHSDSMSDCSKRRSPRNFRKPCSTEQVPRRRQNCKGVAANPVGE